MWLDAPRRVYAASIPVTWGATDSQSGVAHYDVQVRVEDGDWADWLTGTLDTSATYVLGEGQWFSFRVTATDNVGNQASAETSAHIARVTKYYYHGGQRVAMRAGDVVYYLHGDHLGSTSLVTDGEGNVHSRQLFLPYGDPRWQEGTLPTDFGFGGQRHDGSTGLVFMHARYYHAGVGRFVSADTIVPTPLNPQALNRYLYVGNNPLKYTDPTGHIWWIVVLAVIDYGWDAWDISQAIRVMANENSTLEEIETAEQVIALTFALEVIEPDELFATPLPIDDLVRRGIVNEMAEEGIERGSRAADNIPEWLRPLLRGQRTEREVLERLGRPKNTRVVEGLVDGTLVRTIPDYLDESAKVVGEIKDVTQLSGTSQIRSQLAWAEEMAEAGWTYNLHVRQDTKVVPWLLELDETVDWFNIVRNVVSAP